MAGRKVTTSKYSLKDFRQTNSFKVGKMDRSEQIALLTRAQNSIYANVRNLKNSSVASSSAFLAQKNKGEAEKTVHRISAQKMAQMTDSQLMKHFEYLKNIDESKTANIKGAIAFSEEFKTKTGMSLDELAKKGWTGEDRKVMRMGLEAFRGFTDYDSLQMMKIYDEVQQLKKSYGDNSDVTVDDLVEYYMNGDFKDLRDEYQRKQEEARRIKTEKYKTGVTKSSLSLLQ